MLSAAKVRIHGMQDENWVIKDKINQYRGLIKLYGKNSRFVISYEYNTCSSHITSSIEIYNLITKHYRSL